MRKREGKERKEKERNEAKTVIEEEINQATNERVRNGAMQSYLSR